MSDKKVAVVTGANGGLGYRIALDLAGRGMRVVLACRNLDKAEVALNNLFAAQPKAEACVIRLDVSEQSSIEAFAQQFAEQFEHIDILVNNAGVVGMPLQRNSAGYESHLATNYLGVFALIEKLLPIFRDVQGSRIVNVGSLAHLFGKIDLNDLNWEKRRYGQWRAYGGSKLALLNYTLELNRRLQNNGQRIIALGAHPGFAATNMASPQTFHASGALANWASDLIRKILPSAEDAARSALYAACSADARGGEYYGPGGLFEIAGQPARARMAKAATDTELAQKLWSLTETMTGISYL